MLLQLQPSTEAQSWTTDPPVLSNYSPFSLPTDKYGEFVYNDYTGYCIQQWYLNEESETVRDMGETVEVGDMGDLSRFTAWGDTFRRVELAN